jgi:hypothetical protein
MLEESATKKGNEIKIRRVDTDTQKEFWAHSWQGPLGPNTNLFSNNNVVRKFSVSLVYGLGKIKTLTCCYVIGGNPYYIVREERPNTPVPIRETLFSFSLDLSTGNIINACDSSLTRNHLIPYKVSSVSKSS